MKNFGQKEIILEPQDTIRGDYSAPDLSLTVIGDLSYDGCTDVFTAVQSSAVAYGVVPFENSINGAVVGTLDLFADRQNQYADVYICDEASIEIHHYLLGHACKSLQQTDSTRSGDSTPTNQARDLPDPKAKLLTDLQHIKRIYSHPQAFGQSLGFLSQYLKDVDRQEVSSTSKGAEIVSQDGTNTTASISSKDAAETHGLDVLAESIEDQDNNQTRFFFLCKKSSYQDRLPLSIGQPTDNDNGNDNSDKWKTFVTFKINHNLSGALAEVLHVFKTYGLNPTSMNSRPSHRYPWHYIFFVEFYGRKKITGHGRVDAALAKLEEISEGCRCYGSWRVKKRHGLEAAG